MHSQPTHHYANEHAEHFMYHETPAHESYDAFGHDFDTDHSKVVTYGHGDDEWQHEWAASCGKTPYCSRFSKMLSRDSREYKGHHDADFYANGLQSNHLMTAYYVEPDSVVIHEDAIHARLHLHEHEYFGQNGMEFRAAHLDLHMALFQEGIMQVKIKAADEEERFSISNTGIGVDWDQIKVQQHLQDFVKLLDDGILVSGQDKVSYKIQFDPFRIIQYVNGHETIIVNDNDNLYYDAKDLGVHHTQPHDLVAHDERVVDHHEIPHSPKSNFSADVGLDFKFGKGSKNDAKPAAKKAGSVVQGYSVGLDFTVNSTHMYGIPQRNDNFRLEETGFDHPYRLFN
jgi:hypothetical protein